jgi:hypothetical protein
MVDPYALRMLISYIQAGRVIPILGQQLLTLDDKTGETFHHRLARYLASDLRIESELAENYVLNDIFTTYGPFSDDRELIYDSLLRVLRTQSFASLTVPLPIQQLALIRDFRIFLTTTFDRFLERALEEARFGGEAGVRVRAFSPQTFCDLEEEDLDYSDVPLVFKFFGDLSENRNFAATDADVIEYLHSIQGDRRPKRLFGEIKKSHLLILGTDYPNWLARVFLRLAKGNVLWEDRQKQEYLADNQLQQDQKLVTFIEKFSRNTKCFRISPAAFVDRLFAEWVVCDPERAVAQSSKAPPSKEKPCVFISYAREDYEKVVPIKLTLEGIGWRVWLDKEALDSGAIYEQKIEHAIGAAQACIIVLSTNTAIEEPRFLRKEWSWALDREKNFTLLNRRFIHPGRLSESTPVPEEIRKRFNVSLVVDGVPDAAFEDFFRQLLRRLNKTG